jgi:hypothetical protein
MSKTPSSLNDNMLLAGFAQNGAKKLNLCDYTDGQRRISAPQS